MTYLLAKIISAFERTINRKNFFLGIEIDGSVIVGIRDSHDSLNTNDY